MKVQAAIRKNRENNHCKWIIFPPAVSTINQGIGKREKIKGNKFISYPAIL